MASQPEAVPPTDTLAGENSLEMPRPTVAPLVLSLGLALLAAGWALGLAFIVTGAVVLVVGLGIWILALLPGRGHFHEARVEQARRPGSVTTAGRAVEQLRPGMPGYRVRLPEAVHPISAGVKGGLVGGAVMPIPALLWGLLSGKGFWFPVNLLAGMVVPSVGNMDPSELGQLHWSLTLAAIVIHIVMSVVIGLIYGVLLPTLPVVPRPIAWGGLLMPILWTAASYLAMRVVNPALPEQVSWPWFILSQFVFGITMPAVVLGVHRLHPVLAGVLGGWVGAAAMAVPALLWAVASGHGFWYPINVLAGMVLPGPGTADAVQLGSFQADWFVVAAAMHAALSAGFGVLFALLQSRLPPLAAPIAWGGLLLPMAWTGISYSLMGVVNKTLQDHVSWPWFIVSQFVFGVAAAVVVHYSETIHIPPAGQGPDRATEFVTGAEGGGS